ncbi:type I DNA topoisomerase [bacterium]|nr:type I DNA topoisomerase [bacterium]
MPKSLVIVESDAKSKTINRFLGKDFVVRASVGHIKNLPKNRLGVDIDNNFEPELITIRGKGKIVQEIKRLAQTAKEVFIATDADREGEAIAYHIASEIADINSNVKRALFHEITKDAIKKAVENPIEIDLNRVEAQKARRVMDRIVGYKVSPFLWKTIFRGLSAGRVQSVALRLICEREQKIQKFVPEEYWEIEADFSCAAGEKFRSQLVKIDGQKLSLVNRDETEKHVSEIKKTDFNVGDLKTKEIKRNPYPPYTTSTMQQDAARRLGMSTKQVMAIAQQLYEGIDLPDGRVGLITYMRTDSTRLASSAVEEARNYIADNYGLEYVPDKPRFYKNKKSAQDAHEAIRPTSLKRSFDKVNQYLTPAQKKLYKLIWDRFLACQMNPAQLLQVSIDVAGGKYLFRTTGTSIKFKGFMQIYGVEKDELSNAHIPKNVAKGDTLDLLNVAHSQHFTKPPNRYTESSLVKELDTKGIGRPSTYALIISTLLDRKYVNREARTLIPSALGMDVHKILVDQFPDIFNVGFTARMEEDLDQIESGEKDSIAVLKNFYSPFSTAIEHAMEKKDEIKESLQESIGEKCPECGRDLVEKWGRNGKFIACTGYPECTYTRPIEEEVVSVDRKCPECGAPLVAKNGKYGRFLACSNYPDCKHTEPFYIGVPCPEDGCGGELVEKRTRRGKIFYGCSKYPKCTFALWNKPVAVKCESCGFPLMEARSTKAKGSFLKCPKCKAEKELPENE